MATDQGNNGDHRPAHGADITVSGANTLVVRNLEVDAARVHAIKTSSGSPLNPGGDIAVLVVANGVTVAGGEDEEYTLVLSPRLTWELLLCLSPALQDVMFGHRCDDPGCTIPRNGLCAEED